MLCFVIVRFFVRPGPVLRIQFRDPLIFCAPGSLIGFFQNLASDPGSPTHIFENLVDNCMGKKYGTLILCELAQIFFCMMTVQNEIF